MDPRQRGDDEQQQQLAPSAINDFLAYLAVERQMSPHTLDAYRRDLTAVAAWVSGKGYGDIAT
ncbi:MAG TPA: site-specific integrase, partial [Lysobacter sp.]